ncbi:MAG: glycosyltransferase [Candidatus Atribacteria bacterium]|nr:glycosyltransferase [Candidatus Atribacteria bacterium]
MEKLEINITMNQDEPVSEKQPLISVIVPIYNAEKYLPKCIESIQNQTYRNLEIILINDGSTDNSLAICYEYSEKDKRIIVIAQENEGAFSARNSGLDIATGDYIGFVDNDDYIAPDMYQRLLTACLENDADISECGYYEVNEEYEIILSFPLKYCILNGSYECYIDYVKNKNGRNYVWNKLYKKKMFNSIRFPSYKLSEDEWVNSRIYSECKRKATLESCHYYYLIHKKSAYRSPFNKGQLDIIFASKDIYEFYKTRFEELCPYVALRIVQTTVRFYRILRETTSPDIQKEYEPTLVKEFKNYYKLIKGEAYERIKFRNPHIAYFLFNINPSLYYLAYKLYQKIK